MRALPRAVAVEEQKAAAICDSLLNFWTLSVILVLSALFSSISEGSIRADCAYDAIGILVFITRNFT